MRAKLRPGSFTVVAQQGTARGTAMLSIASHRRNSLSPASSAPVSADTVRTASAVVAASLLVAACAHVSVALPFTPVPIVLSDMAVLLVGLLLGPWAGAGALVLYLAEGAAGAPVFSPHGPGGLAQMIGPTGGFLLSYPVVAFLTGLVFEALHPRIGRFAAALTGGLAGSVPLFLFGSTWLALLLHLSPAHALQLAVLPFALGAGVKILVAAALVTSLHHLRKDLSPSWL